MGKPRRKVRQRSIEWFERDVPGMHMDRGGVLQGCSGPLSRFPPLQRANLVPGALFPGFGCGRKNLSNYMFFVLYFLFTSSSPCHKDQFAVSYFSASLIVLIQVYNLEIRHHSLVCCCGTCLYFIYFSRTFTEFKDFSRRLLKFKTFSRVHEPWIPFPTHWQAKIT